MLLELQPEGSCQQKLDLGDQAGIADHRSQRLVQALNAVNDRYGKGALRLGRAHCRGTESRRRSRSTGRCGRRGDRRALHDAMGGGSVGQLRTASDPMSAFA